MDGEKIKLSHIRVTCYTAVWQDDGAERLKPYYDAYEDVSLYINNENPSQSVAFQTSPTWPRIMVELAFVDGVKWSILFTCIMCGSTMILFTRNLAISFFVTGTILIVVTCLLGMLEIIGWQFGPLEAVTVPTVVGLCIDYALHVGHSYIHSLHPERQLRAFSVIKSIGTSVLAAGLTTIFAMLTLAFCEVQLFAVVGIIVATAIVFGICTALSTLVAIIAICGPEGKQCDLKWMFRKVCPQKKRRDSEISGDHELASVEPLNDNRSFIERKSMMVALNSPMNGEFPDQPLESSSIEHIEVDPDEINPEPPEQDTEQIISPITPIGFGQIT